MTEDIVARLSVIEAIVTRLEYRLLGNGQPGELERIDTRIADIEARTIVNEHIVAKGEGVLWVLGVVLGSGILGGLIHIFKIGIR